MTTKMVALVMGLALVLAACGGDGSVFESSATTDRDDSPTTDDAGGGMTPVMRDTVESISSQFTTTADEEACLVDALSGRPELFEFVDTEFTEDPAVAAEVFTIFQACVDDETLGQYIADGIAAEAADLDPATVQCMGQAFVDLDPAIFAEYAIVGTDPTYTPSAEAIAALADVMIECDFEKVIADEIAASAADDPDMTASQAACMTDGIVTLFDRDLLIAILTDPDAPLPDETVNAMTVVALDCIDA